MPVTVRFDPNVTSPQAQVIPNATPRNDGVMTKEQAAKLAGLTGGFNYVVGPAGSGAQYTSINAAIAQAVADGASYSNPKSILILGGIYRENVTLADGVNLVGAGANAVMLAGSLSATVIDGSVSVPNSTTSGVCAVSLRSIAISPTSSDPGRASLFAAAGVFWLLSIENCSIESVTFDHPAVQLTSTGIGEAFTFRDTTIATTTSTTYVCVIDNVILATFDDSTIESQNTGGGALAGGLLVENGSSVKCNYCDVFVASSASALDAVNVAALGGAVELYYCRVTNIALGHCVNVSAGASVFFCDLSAEPGGGDPIHGTLTANLNYGGNSFDGFGSKTITGFDPANMHFYPADNGVGLEFFVGPVGTGARFQTIQSAIDAAVTAGAAFGNPIAVAVLAGVYAEDITLRTGVHLVGLTSGPLGVQINGSVTVGDGVGGFCGMFGMTVVTNAAGKPALHVMGTASWRLDADTCYFSSGFDSSQQAVFNENSNAGTLINLINTTLHGRGATVYQNGAGTLNIIDSPKIDASLAAGAIVLQAQGTLNLLRSLVQRTSSTGICVSCQGGTMKVIDCDIISGDGTNDGVNVGALGALTIIRTYLEIAAGAGNNAIGGAAGATLKWGLLQFATNNKVATTTIGAGAVNIVSDAGITPT